MLCGTGLTGTPRKLTAPEAMSTTRPTLYVGLVENAVAGSARRYTRGRTRLGRGLTPRTRPSRLKETKGEGHDYQGSHHGTQREPPGSPPVRQRVRRVRNPGAVHLRRG